MSVYPTLMIGGRLGEIEDLLMSQGFRLFSIGSPEEARGVLRDFRGLSFPDPVVLSDLSRLQPQELLLKLAEESKLKLILLASRDNVPAALVSRMRRVLKTPLIQPFEADDPAHLRELLSEDEGSDLEVVRTCPSMSQALFRLRRVPFGHRILDLLLPGKPRS